MEDPPSGSQDEESPSDPAAPPDDGALEVCHAHPMYGVTLEWCRGSQVLVNHGTGEYMSVENHEGGRWQLKFATDSEDASKQRAYVVWVPCPPPAGEAPPDPPPSHPRQEAAELLNQSLHVEDRAMVADTL